MIYPTLDEAKTILSSGSYGKLPLAMELNSDMLTPLMALRRLKQVSHHCFLLESAEQSKRWGRYTFLGYDPTMEITCLDGVMKICEGAKTTEQRVHPETVLRRILSENRSPRLTNMPPFTGGLVGYFSYDYIKYSEPTQNISARDEEGFQDVDLMMFDKVVSFDHYRQKVTLIVNVSTKDIEASYQKAELELKSMAWLLMEGKFAENPPLKLKSEFRKLFEEDEFCEMVERGKSYIREGDIFQVVLSNRLEADMEGSLLDTYRILRTTNPSPYMFYFSSDDVEIAGASPETLVKLEGDVVHTFPLAGSRPRGVNEEEDKKLEIELLADEKECAEHNMLVDLGRNDIGKISRMGTVEVEKYMEIERFSHIMHIGSTVKGIIRPEKDALDAMNAILPAGTLSGAPKLRACQIIRELEDNKRGIYGGAIGYIDFSGNLDTCIAIRLAFAKNGKVFVRSGGGIVADSVPKTEYQETVNKAKAVINALKAAEGGMDI